MAGMPIYSQVVPKSQGHRSRNAPKKERPQNLPRDFDPLNYNHGGNAQILNAPLEVRMERVEKKERRKEDSSRRFKNENDDKVEAYLRQNQISLRQQRHSAVRQAEHRLNLRSLPLNELPTSKGHDRTPTERRLFPGERESSREHRRERERDRENAEFDVTPATPPCRHDNPSRPVRKSSSAHKVTEPGISTQKRRFFCREWVFQKIAHCLEQSKTSGALILGDAGSGKTALCEELSSPQQTPQARQQRALNARLLAKHTIQSNMEASLRPDEFVRSLAMQILSHGLSKPGVERRTSPRHANETHRRDSEEEHQSRCRHIIAEEDGEESSKPLLADSEDQRTDEEDVNSGRRTRTIDRVHERETYLDAIVDDHVPEIMPRSQVAPTNPFLTEEQADPDFRLYENHENVFLRNVSKEARSSRLIRQSSEPLTDRRTAQLQKSLSTDQKTEEDKKVENSPPKSRIPVAKFPYPNKNEPRLPSNENSPYKKTEQHDDKKSEVKNNSDCSENKSESDTRVKEETSGANSDVLDDGDTKIENKDGVTTAKDDLENVVDTKVNGEEMELPEYQNIMKAELREEDKVKVELEILLEKKRSQHSEVPPPIPSLPVSPRTLIANAYYEKLMSEPEIQQALLPHNVEKNPDECFKKALLYPLLELDPPKQSLFFLIDGIDEGLQPGDSAHSSSVSRTIAELVSKHQHLLPHWLLLVCTARRHCKPLTKMFTGFRKITLDELSRAHVSADVQRYVLARLDTEPRLRARVSHDSNAAAAAAAALDHLRIKSDGCLLYLEKVLDGVADGFIALREIREIPGTLNGLYLWLAQRLFHGRRFAKVRLLLDVLLAARCGVTEEMLYRCLLTREYSVSREDFSRRLHLCRRIVVMERSTGYLSIFHHSFCTWLLDVKHCTRRYLCCIADGHAALAMYYTLCAARLTPMEINNYVYHMTQLEEHLLANKKSRDDDEVLDLHTIILLWVLDSGCDLESALKRESDAMKLDLLDNKKTSTNVEGEEGGSDSGIKESSECVPLEQIMPELGNYPTGRAGDARALRALLQLRGATTEDHKVEAVTTEQETVEEELVEVETTPPDQSVVFELVNKGDDEALASLLKRWPTLVDSVEPSGGTALHVAARSGAAVCARVLCSMGANTRATDHDGWSPLRAAAWAGHPQVVDVLLEYGCDVDCVDPDNRTALRAAAWSGHAAVVSRLLSAGARADLADGEGRTPLMAAAYMGHADIVRALLDKGADPDHADADGRTALCVAALCAGGAQCAALLLERGASVNVCDHDGATPLLVAAFEGHTEICEVLLENEADIEATDMFGRTALWAAAGAGAGHARCVRLLLFWGACVDTMDAGGRTVLSAAAAQGNVEVVRQLLDRGLDEHHRDNSGWTPLHYAAFEGHIEVCEALLEAGAGVDEADNDGKTALMLSAGEGHARLVKILIDRWGADTQRRAHDGKTALRLAALEGHFETVEVLYSRGADVDTLDADRRSTLYVLALDNRLAMAKKLIVECGASVTQADTEGRTPLHVSAWQGHTEMVNMLIEVGGADVDGRDRCQRTALHAAAWRGRANVLRSLLLHGANAHAVCSQGATPLGIAAQEGHEECVVLLLQHGADPNQADHAGRTPAKVAGRAGHTNICRLLERWTAPSAPPLAIPTTANAHAIAEHRRDHGYNSPEHKRRSVHSSNSTKSSNLSHEQHDLTQSHDKTSRTNLSLSFVQQVARVGRGRREKERDSTILENQVLEKDSKLRSYAANERDADLHKYACERESRRNYSGYDRDNMSPLYASPPRSPVSDICSPTQPNVAFGSQPPSLPTSGGGAGAGADTHFHRDTHMRIILGRDTRVQPPADSKNKRNGIVTNPAMRLVANVRNGLDSAAANIRRTGVALAASASSANPVVKTNAFQWRKETPL